MSEENPKYIKFKCEYCDKEFPSVCSLYEHYHKQHSDIIDFKKLKYKWICEYCGLEFTSRRKLEYHQKEECEEKKKQIFTKAGLVNKYPKKVRYCKVCGKQLKTKDSKIFCSSSCAAKFNNTERKLSNNTKNKIRNSIYKALKDGRLNTWGRVAKPSYPEIFWTNILDNNNIQYEREYHIKEFGYFLDFYIEIGNNKIDLEIDGSQHYENEDRIEHDKIRDERMKSLNYIIYRIPWNEIKTDNGKDMMKDKINNFLTFINTFKG